MLLHEQIELFVKNIVDKVFMELTSLIATLIDGKWLSIKKMQ